MLQAAMARKQRITSGELLVCPICLDKLKDLRLLPCHHSVCFDCLAAHISASASDNTFQCPTCRHFCTVPEGGAEAMPPDLMASKLIDVLASQVNRRCKNWSPQNPHLQPTSYCFTCDCYLCAKCQDNHRKSKELHTHHFICLEPVKEPSNAAQCPVIVAKCSLHKEKTITVYCQQCESVECPVCIEREHADHQSRKITECNVEFSKKLNVLFESCVSYIAHINKLLRQLHEIATQVNTSGKTSAKKITESASELCDSVSKMTKTIRKKQDRFLRKVKEVEASALQQVADSEEVLRAYKEDALALQTRVESVRRMEQNYGRARRTLAMERELQQLRTRNISCIEWLATVRYETITSASLKSKKKRIIGNLTSNVTTSSDDIPERTRPVEDPLFILPLEYEGKYSVCGFAVNNSYVYVVHYYDNRVWIYDLTDPEKDKTLQVPNLEGCNGLACLGDDPPRLLITDFRRKIHLLTLTDDQNIAQRETLHTDYVPGKVTVDSENHLVIPSCHGDRIAILDEHGRTVKEVPLSRQMFSWLTYAMSVKDGYILVDAGNDKLFWADEYGMITHTYGVDSAERMSSPNCAVQDNHGRTIVADSMNDSIHLLGPDHRRLQYLVESREDDPVHRPGVMHLDLEHDLLFMSHGFVGFQEIRAYSYPAHHLPLIQYSRTLTRINMELTLNRIQTT